MSSNLNRNRLKEKEDYYLENGLMVFTSAYHLKRGFCCDNQCRHCPYKPVNVMKKKIKSR